MKNLHVKILSLCLVIVGIWLCAYKVTHLGLPLTPSERTEVWSVEARIVFKARAGTVKLNFPIPNDPPGFSLLDEDFVSGNYGLATERIDENRYAMWSVRRASGKQLLYYRAAIYQDQDNPALQKPASPAYPEVPDYAEPYGSAVFSLLDKARSESADTQSFTRQLLIYLNAKNPDENVAVLRKDMPGEGVWVEDIVRILAGARIPARAIYGLHLVDGMRHGQLEPWLQVYDGKRWTSFNPVTGDAGLPDDFLVWRIGSDPLITLEGGNTPTVEFSIARNMHELVAVAQKRARLEGSRIMDFSLFSLPVQSQNVYRIILMVPLGALLVVFMRNLIGIKTFGTFMPILISLAFRETEWFWGVVLFTLIVALGLAIRFYLEQLKLLLVPRLASVLIIVVLLMAVISVISHQMGLDLGLSVALFPMVILAMTIERMSLVWEESGAGEAFQQGFGSLIVASLGYVVMSNAWLSYLIFVFPELLLVVLAITLMMGRYTGYRLTEFWRFRALLMQSGKS